MSGDLNVDKTDGLSEGRTLQAERIASAKALRHKSGLNMLGMLAMLEEW